MRSDIDRWNAKYADYQTPGAISPESLLTENGPLLSGRGAALDFASGTCDNAIYLASLGYSSFAVDGSKVAIRIGMDRASANRVAIHGFVADLESYTLPEEYFDVVVVIRYLNRSAIPVVKKALKRGGLLFYKTFNARFLDQKPSFPKEYTLQRAELADWFYTWKCIKTNELTTDRDPQSYWVGYKPE